MELKQSGAVRTFQTVRIKSYGPLTSYGPNPSYTNLGPIYGVSYHEINSDDEKRTNLKISFYKSVWEIRTGQQF